MTVTAKVQFVIDDSYLKITSGKEIDVKLESESVVATTEGVVNAVIDALDDVYWTTFKWSPDEDEDGDFVILNLDEIVEDLKFDEFKDKTELTSK